MSRATTTLALLCLLLSACDGGAWSGTYRQALCCLSLTAR